MRLFYDESRKSVMITSRMASMRGHYFDPSLFRAPDGTEYVVSLQWKWRADYEVLETIVLQRYDGIPKKRLDM